MKRQAQMAMDKACKSCGFIKQISILEDKVSGLTARVVHLEECDSFLIGIAESACDVRFFATFLFFPFTPLPLANDFLLLQALAWILLVRLVGFLNESWLLRDLQRESKVFGLIPTSSCYCASSRSCSAYWGSC
jgi:hypothetical protein